MGPECGARTCRDCVDRCGLIEYIDPVRLCREDVRVGTKTGQDAGVAGTAVDCIEGAAALTAGQRVHRRPLKAGGANALFGKAAPQRRARVQVESSDSTLAAVIDAAV